MSCVSMKSAAAYDRCERSSVLVFLSNYVLRHTEVPFLLMWNVFIWWLYVAITLWGCVCAHIDAVAQASLGICAIVGCTLNLSAYTLWCDGRQGNEESGAGAYLRVAPFATMRFFLSHSVWHRTRV